MKITTETAEYLIIGAGPAAICALAKLYAAGIPGDKIIWVDPKFKVGEFGTTYSTGSSVPGNTSVKSYLRVFENIYANIPDCKPKPELQEKFAINQFASGTTCPLKVAAQPLQQIGNHLRQLVNAIPGKVINIETGKQIINAFIQTKNKIQHVAAKRVILATGAEPKTLPLSSSIKQIDPIIAFTESKLKKYLLKNSEIKTVAVIGSSHSAALAVMHLLKAGIKVKQFMNKEYQFATSAVTKDGISYTLHDNTGLKGIVAQFTRELLSEEQFPGMWECYDTNNNTELEKCSHAVVCIGYKPLSSLLINERSLQEFKHDSNTTQILDPFNNPLPGIFGIGIGFPLKTQSPSGETEFSVGIEKFWDGFACKILEIWKNNNLLPIENNFSKEITEIN